MANEKTLDTKPLKEEDRPRGTDTTFEDLQHQLGSPGKHQILIFMLLAAVFTSVAANSVVGVFFTYTPPHTCHAHLGAVNSTDGSTHVIDYAHVSKSTDPAAEVDINMTLTQCEATANKVTHMCGPGQWSYQLLEGEASAVTDYDLVCDRASLAYLASSLFFVGSMLASFIVGCLADVIGRKWVLITTVYTAIGLGVAIAFVDNFAVFVALRLAMGFTIQGLQTSTFILVVEQFSGNHRNWAGPLMMVFWGVGVTFLSVAAWVLKDWRMTQLATLAPLAFAAVYVWFIPESLRWLVTKGKTRQAKRVIKRVATFNNVENPLKQHQSCLEKKSSDPLEQTEKARSSFMDLMLVPELRKRTFVMSFVWFSTNVGYFGMSFSMKSLAGDRYANFLFGALLETLAAAIGVLVITRCGRKRPLIGMLTIGAVCCVVAGVMPRDDDGKFSGTSGSVVTVVSTIGRAVMCMLFSVTDIYAAELFPTVMRTMGVGVCSFMARLGAVITPQIFTLINSFEANVTFQQLPPLIFAGVTFAAALLTCTLPETSNQLLPDTVDDITSGRQRLVTETVIGVIDGGTQGDEEKKMLPDNL